MFNFFRRKPIAKLVDEQLYEAEHQLLNCEHNLEHYFHMEAELTERIQRLRERKAGLEADATADVAARNFYKENA